MARVETSFLALVGALALGGCSDDAPADTETPTETSGDGDGDGDGSTTSGDGDGDASGDGDGDGDGTGDGDGDPATGDGDGDTTGDGDGDGCGAPQPFDLGLRPSQEIHVAVNGTNGPECGAIDSPCQDIEQAASLATPGTAIVIHAGDYAPDNYIAGLHGSADAPIWIGGAQGESRPRFVGGGQALQLSEARYVVVHDLEILDSSQNGLNADDGGNYDDPEAARHIVFRQLSIHDIGAGGNQDCLKLSGLDDYWVLDSTFTRCGGGGSGSAIDHVGCHHGLIHANLFLDLGEGGSAVQNKGGAADIEIRANLFADGGQRAINMGGSTGFEFFRPPLSPDQPNVEAEDIRVIANVFSGGVTPFGFVGCVDCVALNNLILNPSNWVMRILQETTSTAEYEFLPASNGVFANNIIVFDGQVGTAVNVGPDTAPETFSFANNLWYREDMPAQSDPPGGLPVAEQGAIVGEDPLMSLIDGLDPQLSPDSPAIGAGSWYDALSGDFEANCYADPPTVGPLEAG